jgi:hypothetical protein
MTDSAPRPASPIVEAPVTPRRFGRSRLLLTLAVVVLVPLLLFLVYVRIALWWSYSEGERAGYMQKFSLKGWLCKTWEGELAMASLPGTQPEIFRFTVRDEEVAAKINATMGQRVTIHYEQHRGLPTTCFGETDYFGTDARAVADR